MKKDTKSAISDIKKDMNKLFSPKDTLDPEEKWFLDISSSSFGIHQRAEKYFKELYCSSINIKKINEQLREIALDDIWFYKSHREAVRALKIILNFFKKVLNADTGCHHKERTLNTLLEILRSLYQDKVNKNRFSCIFIDSINLLENAINKDEEIFLHASYFLKIIPDSLAEDNTFSKKLNS
ncbi:MAG: hypothetical protein U9N08_03625, partial [Candidatus Caldatribacteriota bacterium]|nr:hypothetical protein [Candidatus Caldatribacteriota bacterium]